MIRTVTLKSGREASIKRMHPWIFSGAIQKADEGIIEGDLVHVLDAKGAFVAQGHFSSGSLAVKVLSLSEETIDDHWFAQRLNEAKSLREVLGFPDKHTNAYRLVHGEGDGLPGLIIDIYADTAVIQPHSKGMERLLQTLSITLIEMGFKNTIHKPTGKGTTSVLVGAVSERIQIRENDMIFNVDVVNGQKTGFFLDQRESRALIGKYARDKNVLNVFSYTGGFSIAAAKAGAKKVISFDASSKALDIAIENAALNNCSEVHSVIKGDAVNYLESLNESFDIIILDPPAFAKHKSARHNAIQAYRRINEAAIKQLAPGGLLFTFSCSQVIDKQLFEDTLVSASINAHTSLQTLAHLRQPADHPVKITHPEGEYLKGLVLRKML